VASVVVTGQESGNGTATLNGGAWTTGDLVLRNSGLDTLIVTATDAVGNPTVKTVVVTINVALPGIDIVYPTAAMPYNLDTITVLYKVNKGAELKKLFTTAAATPDGNWALEVESTPNEAGQTSKKTVTILRDKTGPARIPNGPGPRVPTTWADPVLPPIGNTLMSPERSLPRAPRPRKASLRPEECRRRPM
jgi:hypothetical protein